MLELLFDNRRGDSLELVIPIYNESARLPKLVAFYKDTFDIVLLDAGSTDASIELARDLGCTVYHRTKFTVYTEHFFVEYLNSMSRSGIAFYMFADEHVPISELQRAFEFLQKPRTVVIGKRVDWCYGYRMQWRASFLARGFRRGDAVFCAQDLHSGISYNSSNETTAVTIDHLQIWSMVRFLGQSGAYATEEISRFSKRNWFWFHFVKRFFIFELLFLPGRIWKQRHTSIYFQIWQVLMGFAMPLIGLLCLIEFRYLLSPEDQQARYATFYD